MRWSSEHTLRAEVHGCAHGHTLHRWASSKLEKIIIPWCNFLGRCFKIKAQKLLKSNAGKFEYGNKVLCNWICISNCVCGPSLYSRTSYYSELWKHMEHMEHITQLTPLRNLEHAWLLRIWDLQDYLCSQPGSPIHYWFDLEKMYWMPLSLNFSIFTWRWTEYQTHRVIGIIPWEKYMESTWHDTRDGLGAKYICYFSHIFTMFNTFNQENWAWTTGVSE